MVYENPGIRSENGAIDTGEYEGMWKRGKREGRGEMRWSDGSVFVGEWKKDSRFHGKMTMQDGSVYTGRFLNDKFHGEATLKLTTGMTYQGYFDKGGKCKKQGKLLFNNGNHYEGQLEDFQMHGKGRLYYKDGDVYDGEFEMGQRKGFGLFISKGGDKYIGYWHNDRRDGFGRSYGVISKEYYEGYFSNDRKNGNGKLIFPDL